MPKQCKEEKVMWLDRQDHSQVPMFKAQEVNFSDFCPWNEDLLSNRAKDNYGEIFRHREP